MEDKRALSVSSFSDPFTLYNLDEMLDRLKTKEKNGSTSNESLDPKNEGYNIFKDSIRRIDDMEAYRKREQ